MANLLTEFLFPALGARGALIEFDEGVDAMLGSRPYPADVRHLLGDAVAAMPLLASHARFAGRRPRVLVGLERSRRPRHEP